MSKTYEKFIELTKKCSDLEAVSGLLQWDQKTFMPEEGVRDKSSQLATISLLAHEKLTSKKMEKYLSELENEKSQKNLSNEQKTNVREMAWEFHRAASVPAELVKKIAKTTSLATQKWQKAREKSDFSLFLPYFKEIVELKKQEAEAIGYRDQQYDALLDGFEPGMKTADVKTLFSNLRKKMVPIVSKIIDSGIRPDTSFVTSSYPVAKQKEFNHNLAEKLGFDFKRGRIDESAHPFTSGSLNDVRFTTNYNRHNMRFAMFATIHETGHALYEQGYKQGHYGTPMGKAVSLGIHESQSRMWENIVGRSKMFWKYYYPILKKTFPNQLKGYGMNEFYAAVNDVHPSLIRVEADEATYNLHILLRFEMEHALFTEKIEPEDAPELWNEKMEKYLRIEVPDHARGILQDIHWSLGYFGYFPTYTLGNLYSAQFYQQAEKDIPELSSNISQGKTNVLLDWLRKNIHEKGKLHRANELVREVTGKKLNEDIFINYLKEKYGELYGF